MQFNKGGVLKKHSLTKIKNDIINMSKETKQKNQKKEMRYVS
jgi:hypothetical protein